MSRAWNLKYLYVVNLAEWFFGAMCLKKKRVNMPVCTQLLKSASLWLRVRHIDSSHIAPGTNGWHLSQVYFFFISYQLHTTDAYHLRRYLQLHTYVNRRKRFSRQILRNQIWWISKWNDWLLHCCSTETRV